MLDILRSLEPYQQLRQNMEQGEQVPALSLMRAARLPLISTLHQDLGVPLLLVTDRMDRALSVVDELGFWLPGSQRVLFSEPSHLFYEPAAWGINTRRDRLQALTLLASYQIPGASQPLQPPLIITTMRALMTRTLPRREFLKASKVFRLDQEISPESLVRWLVDIGYSAADVVVEPGQFSRRGGLLDIWAPAEAQPARIEFFGDILDTMRSFDPATQRKIRGLDHLLITPAREILPGRATEVGVTPMELSEFHLPLVHRSPASLLDYLPSPHSGG